MSQTHIHIIHNHHRPFVWICTSNISKIKALKTFSPLIFSGILGDNEENDGLKGLEQEEYLWGLVILFIMSLKRSYFIDCFVFPWGQVRCSLVVGTSPLKL